MAKVNVYGMKRPYTSVTETKTFVDPLQPGEEITLTLRGLTPVEQFAAIELASQYLEEYGENGSKKLPAIDGKIPKITKMLAMSIATLVYAQCGEGDDAYSFEEFVGIAELFPNAYQDIAKWADSLLPVKDPKESASGKQQQK